MLNLFDLTEREQGIIVNIESGFKTMLAVNWLGYEGFPCAQPDGKSLIYLPSEETVEHTNVFGDIRYYIKGMRAGGAKLVWDPEERVRSVLESPDPVPGKIYHLTGGAIIIVPKE